LKEAFESKNLLLSSSLSGYVDKISEAAYDIQELGKLLDFANVMSYDYHGFWDRKTGHHSPIKKQPDDQHNDFNLVT
jgi:GH18 family chitinase